MRFSKILRYPFFAVLVILAVCLVLASVFAIADANSVAASRLGESVQAITANALKPRACDGLNLVSIVVCPSTGLCKGTGANNLILGTAGNDHIQGKNGGDCIIAGGGDDVVQSSKGGDICIEGPGNDTYNGCTVIEP